MFDTILNTLASRFGLENQVAKKMMGMLVGLMFDDKKGGIAGFVDAFRQQGLGNIVDSWVGSGENLPLSGNQLEQVLGSDTVNDMASKLGVDPNMVKNATAGILPSVINGLTADGRLPTSIPAGLMGSLGDIGNLGAVGDMLKGVGGAGLGAVGAGAAAVGAGAAAVGSAGGAAVDVLGRVGGAATGAAGDAARAAGQLAGNAGGGSPRKLLPWLLLLGALAASFFGLRSCKDQETETPPADAIEPAAAPAAMPAPTAAPISTNTRFSMENAADGKVNIAGQVPSDGDKTKLMDALIAAFGAGNLNGDITVDASGKPAGWMDKLIGMLPELKAAGLKLGIDDDKFKIDTSALSEDQRMALSDKLRGAFAGFEIDGLWDKATAAIGGLKAGFTIDELTKALNLMNVRFDTGSANITKDSLGILVKAAEAIKMAPAGSKLEVGGHTDNTGNAGANMKLSQARADAVMAKLTELGVDPAMLGAKGYGQDKPTADNASAEGRAKNRRIEFTGAM